jgi:hypothetical protein
MKSPLPFLLCDLATLALSAAAGRPGPIAASAALLATVCGWSHAADFAGARLIDERGYPGCVELRNATTRVLLEPNLGGRVLSYTLNGIEALYQDSAFDGVTRESIGRAALIPGGRFDVGPEFVLPPRPDLWLGRWRGEITGERSARLTSGVDAATGLQLVREFSLDAASSRLACTQTIVNHASGPRRTFHWSRTLAAGGGICVVPLNPVSRYPRGYLTYGPDNALLFRPPDEPHVLVRDGSLLIIGPPQQKKFAVDVADGWLAYALRSGLLFVKRFAVHADRVYGEIAGNAVSIWYSENRMCELEPIGPLEILAPGQRASYREEWWLLPQAFPADPAALDVAAVRRTVTALSRGTPP